MQDQQSQSSSEAALIGQQLPALISPATNNFDIAFDQLEGYQAVLFFYPQNGLPGVTQLAKDFAARYQAFKQIKTCVFGVTSASLEDNQSFKDSLDLPFQIISDASGELSSFFNTKTERTIFGEPIETLEQSSFLIDGNGKVVREWRTPEVRGHAAEVLEVAHKLAEGIDDPSRTPEPEQDTLPFGEGHAALAKDLAEILEVE